MNKLERSLQELYQKIYYRAKGARKDLLSYRFQTEYDKRKNFIIVTMKVFEKGTRSLSNGLTMLLDKQGRTIAIQEHFNTSFYILDEENIYEIKADKNLNYTIIHHYYDGEQQKFNSKEIYTTVLPLSKENYRIRKLNDNLVCFELDGMGIAERCKADPKILYNQSTRESVIPFHHSSYEEEPFIELHRHVYYDDLSSFLHFFVDENGEIIAGVVDSTRGKVYEVGKNGNLTFEHICSSVIEDLAHEAQQKEQQKAQQKAQAQLYSQQLLAKVRKKRFFGV